MGAERGLTLILLVLITSTSVTGDNWHQHVSDELSLRTDVFWEVITYDQYNSNLSLDPLYNNILHELDKFNKIRVDVGSTYHMKFLRNISNWEEKEGTSLSKFIQIKLNGLDIPHNSILSINNSSPLRDVFNH